MRSEGVGKEFLGRGSYLVQADGEGRDSNA